MTPRPAWWRRCGWGTLAGLCLAGAALPGVVGCVHNPLARLQKDEEPGRDKELEVKTVGDVTEVANAAPTVVNGVGLVTDLEGTGGGAPLGFYRNLLENELKRRAVPHIKQVLDSENNALVLVTALIPPGAHKGDLLDIEVTLPPGSRASSLRGGYLQECVLYNYDTTKHVSPTYEGGDRLIRGHILARAKGPILVGLAPSGPADERPKDGEPAGADEAVRLKKGWVWGGGVSLIDRPFFLALKNDQQFARVANAVAERINQTFRDDGRKRLLVLGQVTDRVGERFAGPGPSGTGATARAANRELVYVRVPWEYRLNPARYLRVARLIPLQDSPEIHDRYRRRMAERLLDPGQTLSAALRLEALGTESVPALKAGLKSEHVLVRFCAAEALAYLGEPAGGEELARLVVEQPKLRSYCLTALTSLNEAVCKVRLTELLASPTPEVRYGAFCALRVMDERLPEVRGEALGEAFWLHRLAPVSPGLVHLSANKRAEVTLFGEEPRFVPPVAIVSSEFTVTAGKYDDRCIVGRFSPRHGRPERRTCSLKVEDVLRALADLGATYTEAADVLLQADRYRGLSCPVRINALTPVTPVEDLAKNAKDPAYWKPPRDGEEDLPPPTPAAVSAAPAPAADAGLPR